MQELITNCSPRPLIFMLVHTHNSYGIAVLYANIEGFTQQGGDMVGFV